MDVERLITTLRRIVPEIGELVGRRYLVLRGLHFMQPVGRRALAERLRVQERAVRNEVDFLREAGFLDVRPEGMGLTREGEALLWELKDFVSSMTGLSDLESALAKRLNLKRVMIAVGDSDTDSSAKGEMARLAARYLRDVVANGDIIAVSGGSTMLDVVTSMNPMGGRRDVTVLPARGGLGEDVEIQANTIAARMSKALGGTYRLLHFRDDLSDEAAHAVSQDPKVREVLHSLKGARILMHGIGLAEDMAKRRGLSAGDIAILKARGAVGEAFGYYLDARGEIVYSTTSIGLRPEDLRYIGTVVAVGGGTAKAQAVLAVMRCSYHEVLITDEGAARAMAHSLGLG